MDTSKEYIEMCRKAVEVQEAWEPDVGDWTDHGTVTIVWSSGAVNYISYGGQASNLLPYGDLTWLPRQDQLQGMLVKKYGGIFSVICRFCDWFQHEDYSGETITGEQLWLKFVMYELHGKKWDGKQWNGGKSKAR